MALKWRLDSYTMSDIPPATLMESDGQDRFTQLLFPELRLKIYDYLLRFDFPLKHDKNLTPFIEKPLGLTTAGRRNFRNLYSRLKAGHNFPLTPSGIVSGPKFRRLRPKKSAYDCLGLFNVRDPIFVWGQPKSCDLSLMATYQLIHNEAVDYFYKFNTFRIVPGILGLLGRGLRSGNNLSFAKNISMKCKEFSDINALLAACQCHLPALRTLEIIINVEHCEQGDWQLTKSARALQKSSAIKESLFPYVGIFEAVAHTGLIITVRDDQMALDWHEFNGTKYDSTKYNSAEGWPDRYLEEGVSKLSMPQVTEYLRNRVMFAALDRRLLLNATENPTWAQMRDKVHAEYRRMMQKSCSIDELDTDEFWTWCIENFISPTKGILHRF